MRLILAMAAALACHAVAARAAPAREPASATPLGNPGAWVTHDDYPTEALMDNLEGTTNFLLTIDVSGRVENCTVTVSSGTDQLDVAACNLITQRARFRPATDGYGRPIPGSYSSRVRWILPKVQPQPRPLDLELSFIVETDGSMTDCRIVRSEGVPQEQLAAMKPPCASGDRTTPFVDETGAPVRRLVKMRRSATIEPAP